jgi:hypothetical protein
VAAAVAVLACCIPLRSVLLLHLAHVSITTPVASALKNYYIYSASGFWVQVTVSVLKSPHGGLRSETDVTLNALEVKRFQICMITVICDV